MCWQDGLAALAQGRPGLLGMPGFYVLAIALYVASVLGVGLWWTWSERSSRPAWQLALGLAWLAILHGWVYSVVNPPWFAPDEPSHFEYAQAMADRGRVPALADLPTLDQAPVLASMYQFDFWRLNGMAVPDRAPSAFAAGLTGDWKEMPATFVVDDRFLWYYPQIGNEPPLYYLWTTPAFWSSQDDVLSAHYRMRWLTLLLYVGCVLLVYLIAGTLWPRSQPRHAPATASLVLFLPMLSYMGTSVNNDVAAALVATAWFAVAARLFLRGWSWPRILLLLLLTALGLITKKTTLYLAPLLAIAMLLYLWMAHPLGRRDAPAPASAEDAARNRRLRRAVAWLGLAVGVLLIAASASVFAPAPAHARNWMARPAPDRPARSGDRAFDGAHAFHLTSQNDSAVVQRLSSSRLRAVRGRDVVLQAMVSGAADGQVGRLELVTNRERIGQVFTAGPTWQPVQITAHIPDDAQYLRVLLRAGDGVDAAGDGGVDSVYFDRVKLNTVEPPPAGDGASAAAGSAAGENLLYNGSAEQAASRWRVLVVAMAHGLGLDGYVTPWFMQPERTASWDLLRRGGEFAFVTFWGRFGSLNVTMPSWWDAVWKYAALLSLAGLVLFFVHCRQVIPECSRRHKAYFWLLVAGLALAVAQVMSPLFSRPDPNWLPQGRFLFTAIAPIAVLLYTGWLTLTPARFRGWLFYAILAGMLFMDTVALLTLAAHSYCS